VVETGLPTKEVPPVTKMKRQSIRHCHGGVYVEITKTGQERQDPRNLTALVTFQIQSYFVQLKTVNTESSHELIPIVQSRRFPFSQSLSFLSNEFLYIFCYNHIPKAEAPVRRRKKARTLIVVSTSQVKKET
jgi:hypothetical protein